MSNDKLTKRDSNEALSKRDNRPVVAPRVDVAETEEAITLWADMPGVDQKSVNIDLERNRLTISAESAEVDTSGRKAALLEYRTPMYERSFVLGDTIDREHISASVKNGVLTLVLPKTTEAKPRRIEVLAG